MQRCRSEIIIMGVQGSGKGTQAKRLVDHYDLVHISTGDIFRWHITNHTKLGGRIQRTIAHGKLVSDETVTEIVADRLRQHDWNYGFILDGFPRSVAQTEFLLESYNLDATLVLDVPDDVVVQRIQARRVCSKCNAIYNVPNQPPKKEGSCDACGGPVIQREDDTPEAVRRRLADYHAATDPMLRLFDEAGMLHIVNANQNIETVAQGIRDALRLPPAEPRATNQK